MMPCRHGRGGDCYICDFEKENQMEPDPAGVGYDANMRGDPFNPAPYGDSDERNASWTFGWNYATKHKAFLEKWGDAGICYGGQPVTIENIDSNTRDDLIRRGDVIDALKRIADDHENMALFGETEQSRIRESVAAALQRAQYAVAFMPQGRSNLNPCRGNPMITPEVSVLLARFSVDVAALREAGWDAEWFSDDGDGPYVACHVFNETCPCCSGKVDGWTVVNVTTATGHSSTWHGDNAQCDAEEVAGMLNAAWHQGAAHRSAEAATA